MTVADKLDSMLWVEFAILGFVRDKMKDEVFEEWISQIKNLKNPEDVNSLSELSLRMVEKYDIDLGDKKYVTSLIEESDKSLYAEYLVDASKRVNKFNKAEIVSAFITSIIEVIAPGTKVTAKVIKQEPEEEKVIYEDKDFGPLDLDFTPKKTTIVDNYIESSFEKYYVNKDTCKEKESRVQLSKDGAYLSVGDSIFKTNTINTFYISPTYSETNKDLKAVVIIGEYGSHEPFKGSNTECLEVISEIKKSLKF